MEMAYAAVGGCIRKSARQLEQHSAVAEGMRKLQVDVESWGAALTSIKAQIGQGEAND